jgi:2-keto-4-pentenoate hydratase/2-oxohepta-3-ene-1,7-dioic acid hydratase in catechol pathway
MRLIGFQDAGAVTIGVDLQGLVAPVAEVSEFYGDLAHWSAVARSRGTADTAHKLSDLVLRPAVPQTAKILCVGSNYASHTAETGRDLPAFPTVFARYASTLGSDGDAVPVPPGEHGLDWEVELAAVVGEVLCDVDERTATAAVFGYTVLNDISARTFQFHTTQHTLGKNADGSAPMGPIVTADAIDTRDLRLTTTVNGEVMQSDSTANMIFGVGYTLQYISQVMTLHPGDVLSTGTPGGVGFTRTPPVLLHGGDEVTVSIDGIGSVRSPIVG